jgi:NAD(P)-dependent dehydrogenase (short-subunit alcohol dehydrogenase family)
MTNRVVVISGATSATAACVARAFARQGASLALVSSNSARLEALAVELALPPERLLIFAADLREPASARLAAERVLDRFGHIDVLLHLVGGWVGGKTIEQTPAVDLEMMLDQHLWTTFHLIQAFLPALIQNGWGRVIAISSPVTSEPAAKMGAYAIGKSAEESLLLTLAREVKDNGVTANLIQLRSIDTTGSGKGTAPEEITAVVEFLCSEPASKINGARIPLY